MFMVNKNKKWKFLKYSKKCRALFFVQLNPNRNISVEGFSGHVSKVAPANEGFRRKKYLYYAIAL
ncbi:predicted protein [Sclerotinia sclerotiorum 1980 UF-70]|uniref:Uncharacterized protein n=1 Tax=Sclerotinia sclerotiorum (strain ATCC 18683 / 1980 / Ss-1) TaxID=665079 RepID=A7E6U3_SCLS1|nr:predicted protein [Sclerotinia sclerotiorum 1980 UF-70]EDN91615.1 predicted protein [Sclerotinia sclerotiorum 1980 UF-70]